MIKLFAALRRRWPIIVALTVIGLLAGAASGILSSNEGPADGYQATQVIIARKGTNSIVVPQDELKVVRGLVPDRAAEILGADNTNNQVARGVSTSFDQEASSISITCARSSSPAAEACTQAFTDAFLTVANEDSQQDERLQLEELDRSLEDAMNLRTFLLAQEPSLADPNALAPPELQQQLSTIDSEISNFETQIRDRNIALARAAPYESLGPEPARQLSQGAIAVPASVPLRAGVMGLIGLIFGAIVALVVERMHPRIDSRDDVIDVTDLPILTEVGYVSPRHQPIDDGVIRLEGAWAEPYRRLRAAVRFVQQHDENHADTDAVEPVDGAAPAPNVSKTFLIASTTPGEGKSTTTALLGLALAEQEPTIVIGCDFRRPTVHRLLGLPEGPTLTDRAQMDAERPSLSDIVLPTATKQLYLVGSGPGSREVAGRIKAAREVLRGANGTATLVVDTSPLRASSDALELMDEVDYTILTVRSGAVTAKQLAETIDVLTRLGTPILGIVLIGASGLAREQQHYYDYYAST